MNSDELSLVADRDTPIRPVKNIEVSVPREQEYGVRNPRKLPDPRMPSTAEVEQHYLTHLPFRNWYQYIIQGKGEVAPRFR